MHMNGQIQNENESNGNSFNIDTPSIPVHNDTSHDEDGKDHDSEPFRNNGRGTDEANSQNYAAETNGTHGMPVEEFQQVILNQHNKYRRQMCANDLINDDNLHLIAQERANHRANEKQVDFSNDYNENVYIIDTGDPSKITGDMVVNAWYDENKYYNANNESSAQHFSQLVWKNSKKLGVGHAYSSHKLFILALYKPPGNIRGQFAANVGCNSNNQQYQGNR